MGHVRALFSRSGVLSLALVGAAGFIAWNGIAATTAPPAAEPATEVTIAADAPVAELPAGRSVQGFLPTRVVVPSAGIDTPIAEVGVVQRGGERVWETAWRSAGHHLNSARPGQPGNMVLTGHVSVADAANVPVFATLDAVAEGDIVEVYAGDARYRYAITTIQVVDPDETRVLKSDHRSLVTLITCTPDLRHRLVLTGQLVDG